MATPTQSTMLRALTSPVRAAMNQPSKRSILKRPAALPMSPRVQVASFSVLLSPSSPAGLKSAHVHFPSPSQLAATITTYSPGSYDRGPISVSPNPLSLPGWNERVYSPSIEGFKLAAPPKVFRSLSVAYQPSSPAIVEFEDPRSPKLQPKAKASNSIHFAKMASKQPVVPSRGLDKALTSYPRSPYPTAPVSPSEADTEMETRGRQWPRNRGANDTISAGARARARAHSVEERRSTRNKKGLTLNGRSNPVVSSLSVFTPIPSPLSKSFGTPAAGMATSSLNRAHKPAPLALSLDSESAGSDQLSNAFWDSVTIEAQSADEPMVTALEYPESATEYEEKIDIELRSASQPTLMFASANGVLFSPGLPKPHAAMEKIRASLSQALMSPSAKKSSFGVVRKDITAPSPNDPFASFPSFGAALQFGGLEGAIQYPPRVVLERA